MTAGLKGITGVIISEFAVTFAKRILEELSREHDAMMLAKHRKAETTVMATA